LEHRIVQRILAESDSPLTAADVKEDSKLRGDLGLGSLQAVSLVLGIEDEFGVRVEDEELQTLVTVGDIMRLVREKQAGLARSGAPGETSEQPDGT
jgi:acyl carrier protein